MWPGHGAEEPGPGGPCLGRSPGPLGGGRRVLTLGLCTLGLVASLACSEHPDRNVGSRIEQATPDETPPGGARPPVDAPPRVTVRVRSSGAELAYEVRDERGAVTEHADLEALRRVCEDVLRRAARPEAVTFHVGADPAAQDALPALVGELLSAGCVNLSMDTGRNR